MTKTQGRPTAYNKDVDDEICHRLANGESLASICRDEHIPDKSTVFRWLLSGNEIYQSFRDRYAQAREIQYQNMADEILDIADDGANDWLKRNDPDNEGYAFNGEAVGRSRLRVDTRKWFMSKVLPKFSDKPQEKQDNQEGLLAALANLIDRLPN